MYTQNESRDETQCPNGGFWYACAATQTLPQFAGCCLVDACQHGCVGDNDRTPRHNASISSEAPSPTSFRPGPTSSISGHVETFASISAGKTILVTVTENATPTSQPSADTEPTEAQSNNTKYVRAIVGGSVGGAVLLAAIVSILFFLRRKRRMREERRATLRPTYPSDHGDMSEHLTGATTTSINGRTTVATDSATASANSIPQLDSHVLVPPSEAISDALGNIPELPADEQEVDPSTTPRSSQMIEVPRQQRTPRNRDPDNHVMSWSNFTSMGSRNAMSRLSQPHTVPEGNVWGNMSPTRTKQDA